MKGGIKMSKMGHEVMVCERGDCWTLILRRGDAGLMELPTVYTEEKKAIQAAHEFIRSRLADSRYADEVWFCLASQDSSAQS